MSDTRVLALVFSISVRHVGRYRMFCWKHGLYRRAKVKRMVALAASLDMAIKHTLDRKKVLSMSYAPAIRYAMPSK